MADLPVEEPSTASTGDIACATKEKGRHSGDPIRFKIALNWSAHLSAPTRKQICTITDSYRETW
jgi:hypothetical protein